jgi:hypothetical protein
MNTTGRGALRRRLVGAGAAAATVAVVAGLTLAAPLSASADNRNDSYAKGQFLSGSVLGTNLGNLVAVKPAVAHNDGTQGTQTQSDPFSVTALNSLTVGSGGALQLGLGSFLQLGAVHQFATAKSDGTSMAASGAVANNGAIQTNSNSSAPANATFDLSKLLGSQFASTLADLKLELGAVAAQANGNLTKASGTYNLASAKLVFSSPAVAKLTQKVDSALDSVNTDLGSITGKNGDLIKALSGLLPLNGSGLNLLGSNVTVTATINTGDLKAAVQDLLNSKFATDGVSVNLENGTVSLDLAALLGGKLNHLAPGTELINDKVIGQVLDSITSKVATIADQVIAKVKQVLNDAVVNISLHAAVSVPQLPLVSKVCETVQTIIPGITGTGGSGSGNPVGGIVGGILGGVGGTVDKVTGTATQIVNKVVCHQVSTAVAPKLTELTANIHGSVKQIIAGDTSVAQIALSVLGITAHLDLKTILGGLGSTLSTQLFGSDGTIAKLTTALQNGLVHPALAGLVGPGTGPVSLALTKLLSVKVNLQETTTGTVGGMAAATGKMFTETAVRVTVLGGVGGSSLATVNLAQATVGPNVTSVVPGCTVNCGGNPGCTVNCGGNPGTPSTPAGSIDHLATTGLSIAALVAAMLALLAAGAYLVREGYKRRQLTPVA